WSSDQHSELCSAREHAGIPLLLGSRGSGSSVWNPGGHRATAATQAGRTPAPDGRAPDADGRGEARHLSRTVGACPPKPAVGRRTAPLCPRVSVRGHWLRAGAADVATGGSIRPDSATRGLSARPAPDRRPASLAAACAGTEQDATSTGAGANPAYPGAVGSTGSAIQIHQWADPEG